LTVTIAQAPPNGSLGPLRNGRRGHWRRRGGRGPELHGRRHPRGPGHGGTQDHVQRVREPRLRTGPGGRPATLFSGVQGKWNPEGKILYVDRFYGYQATDRKNTSEEFVGVEFEDPPPQCHILSLAREGSGVTPLSFWWLWGGGVPRKNLVKARDGERGRWERDGLICPPGCAPAASFGRRSSCGRGHRPGHCADASKSARGCVDFLKPLCDWRPETHPL